MAKIPGTPASKKTPSVVAGHGPAGGSPGGAGAGSSAGVAVVKHGGNRGGRARSDGLVPGSEEALEADREADRVRKQITRANTAAAQEPPPIPSMPAQAPPGAVAGLPGAAPGIVVAPDPWTPEMFTEIVDAMIDGGEEFCVGRTLKIGAQIGIPKDVLDLAQKDSRWGDGSKRALKLGLPQIFADGMNASGIPAKYRNYLLVGVGALNIGRNQLSVEKRLAVWARQNPDKLLKRAQPAAVTAPAAQPERKAA
jgi:hypothetical protein